MYASTENGQSLWRQIIESTRNIFKSHPHHFHAISILFLLPITSSLIVYPSFCHHLLPRLRLLVLIVYTLFFALFFIFGVGTTIYSTVQVLYNRPIDVVSSIKSMRNSFSTLLSTFMVIFTSIVLVSILVLVFVVRILKSNSNHLLYLVISGLIVIVPILIWLQVNWSLCYAITVVESKKGYEALRRSRNLVKGKRWVAFGILMYYVPTIVVMVVWSAVFLARDEQWRRLGGILLAALGSVMGYVLMNQYIVANVVLYMYCNQLNHEKVVAGEYVSLPVEEEEKDDHLLV